MTIRAMIVGGRDREERRRPHHHRGLPSTSSLISSLCFCIVVDLRFRAKEIKKGDLLLFELSVASFLLVDDDNERRRRVLRRSLIEWWTATA